MGAIGVTQSRKETTYTISFTTPLTSASANNESLYHVLEGVKKVVKKHKETVYTKALKIRSVVYNPGPNTVTIALAKRYKGMVQVTIAPGLQATDGTTSETSIRKAVP